MWEFLTSGAAALGTVVGAIVAWFTVQFIGNPIRKFWDLRGEVRQRMHEYANVRAAWREIRDGVEQNNLTDAEKKRLDEAEQCLRVLATKVKAFGETEWAAAKVLGVLGFDSEKASAGLFGLSNSIGQAGQERAFHTRTAENAFKFRREA